MKHYRRKNLGFGSSKEESITCDFLDLLGKNQSSFITKLVINHLDANGIKDISGMSKKSAIEISKLFPNNGDKKIDLEIIVDYLSEHGMCIVPLSVINGAGNKEKPPYGENIPLESKPDDMVESKPSRGISTIADDEDIEQDSGDLDADDVLNALSLFQ